MPAKKKTNYVTYELQKLEKYVKQLMNYLDANPPDEMEDRIEMMESTRGNPILKVIASKEQQLNCFFDKLQKLPSLIEDINKLRKTVDDEEEREVRGGHDLPGFMRKAKQSDVDSFNKKRKDAANKIDEEFPDDPLGEEGGQISLPASTTQEREEPGENEDVIAEEIETEEIEEDEDPAWEDD